jgi:NAD-dependent SIR2 family protein deacetylase
MQDVDQSTEPFFSRSETKQAIEKLARAKRLTLLVGAGASAEVGLPSWRQLVEGLLTKVGNSEGLVDESVDTFCDWTIASEGLPAAGSMARSALGNRLADEIRRLLYGEMQEPLLPGSTARAVAQIRALWEDACEIATTNYDMLLEEALKAIFPRGKVKSRTDEYAGTPGNIEVRHLHGLLTKTAKRGKIVLSEADYYHMADPDVWQETYFRKQLGESLCLFIGTSVTDPNLLRYLYRHRSKHGVVVVLVRQADVWSGVESIRSTIRTARERVAQLRWKDMGVTALYADFYSQSAQFLWEVVQHKKLGKSYETYGTRIDRWAKQVRETILQLDDPSTFAARQDELQQQSRAWLDSIVQLIEESVNIGQDERLAIHLWVRLPRERALVMAVCSDRAWRDPRVLPPRKIALPSDWAAINAFCRGIPVVWSADRPAKWNYVRAIPVHLESESWGRLPVGVVSLASTKPRDSSVLGGLRPEVLDSISVYLENNAADLLHP